MNSKRNEFVETLKVEKSETIITEFPTDEAVAKMRSEGFGYLFNVEDIEKKIKISKLTRERRTIIFISRKNKYRIKLLL